MATILFSYRDTQSPAELQGCFPSLAHNKQQQGYGRVFQGLENHQKSMKSMVIPETSLATTATHDDFHCG